MWNVSFVKGYSRGIVSFANRYSHCTVSFANRYSREQNNSSLLLRSRFTVHERNFGATQPMQMNLAQHPLRIILLEVGFMVNMAKDKH